MSERYVEPRGNRLRRAVHLVVDHIQHAPDHASEHHKPSAQRDVGKTARQAAGVQMIIQGLQENRWDSMGNYMDDPEPPEAA